MAVAVSSQRSGSLVLWLVVGWILCITSLILGIYFYVDADRVSKQSKQQTLQYNEVIAPEMLKSDDLDKLRTAKNDPNSNFGGMRLLDVALAQKGQLAKLISGSDDDATATGAAAHAIANAKAVGAKSATDSLTAVVDALITEVHSLTTEAENNKKDSDESKQKLAQTVEATQAQIESLTKTMDGLRAEKDGALLQVQEISEKQSKGFESTAADLQKQLQGAQDQINQVNTQNATLGSQVKKLETELDKTRQKLNDIRIDPTKSVTQQVDPTNDDNLPVGKASIEVIRVGATTSECRITRLSLGAALSEGDLVA